MSVSVKCKCGAALGVTAQMAGKMGTCPKCGKTMRIPKEVAAANSHAAPTEAAPPAESAAEGEALYPVNIRWPRFTLGPLVMAALSLMVIIAVAIAAVSVIPTLSKKPGEEKRITAVDYVNPKYGYRLVVPAAWKIADDNADNLVLQGRTGSAVMTVALRQGAESINEFAEALKSEAEKEPGFDDYDWKQADIYGYPMFQITYSYARDGARWKALARAFRTGEAWMVVTFRASASDFPRDMREFEDVCRSIKTE